MPRDTLKKLRQLSWVLAMIGAIARVCRGNKRISAVFAVLISAGIFGLSPSPTFAHCAGKHTGNHPHCDGGGGGGGGGEDPLPADFNPEIVYRTSQGHVVIVNGDGSNATIVYKGKSKGSVGVLSWHPNGAEILFEQTSMHQGGIYRLKLFDLDEYGDRVLESFNPGPRILVTEVNQNRAYSRWSPVPIQGKYWIAFRDESVPGSNDKDIFLVDEDGGNRTQLPSTPTASEGWPSWAPDATRLAVRVLPTNGFASPADVEILSLGTEPGDCVDEPICVIDRVSLFLENNEISGGDAGDWLEANTLFDLTIDSLDWSNSGENLIVNTTHWEPDTPHVSTFWTVPTAMANDDLQQAVNGTIRVIQDPKFARIWPVWSPDDNALLYRFNTGTDSETMTCDPSPPAGSRIIGILDNPNEDDPTIDDPKLLDCADEYVMGADGGGFVEWWRGGVGFTPPASAP